MCPTIFQRHKKFYHDTFSVHFPFIDSRLSTYYPCYALFPHLLGLRSFPGYRSYFATTKWILTVIALFIFCCGIWYSAFREPDYLIEEPEWTSPMFEGYGCFHGSFCRWPQEADGTAVDNPTWSFNFMQDDIRGLAISLFTCGAIATVMPTQSTWVSRLGNRSLAALLLAPLLNPLAAGLVTNAVMGPLKLDAPQIGVMIASLGLQFLLSFVAFPLPESFEELLGLCPPQLRTLLESNLPLMPGTLLPAKCQSKRTDDSKDS